MARSEQEAIARLAEVGRRIDEIAIQAEGARIDTRVRVERRVKVLRAREAVARSRVRPRSGSLAHLPGMASSKLEQELDEIDTEIAIAVGQLALDAAEDRSAFEGAVESQIEAYRGYFERLRARAEEGGGLDTVSEAVQDGAAVARRLQRLREASGETSATLRAGVLAALDELEHDAERVRQTWVRFF